MLQSEFEERTGMVITPEEYYEVEKVYTSITMDKDEFCHLWKKCKDNKIIKELMETIGVLREDLSRECKAKGTITEEYRGLKIAHEKEVMKLGEQNEQRMRDFGRKVIVSANETDDLYCVLEEEFGMDFIIKTKLEEDIAINSMETDYMIKKLS